MANALKRLQSPVTSRPSFSDDVEKDKEIVKQGTLRKQGGEYKSWKERWFVLSKDSLSYYKKKEDLLPIKAIGVAEIISCQKEPAGDRPPARFPFYFSVETDARTYVISARNEVERNEWVDAIQSLTKSAKAKDPVADLRKELEATQIEQPVEIKPAPLTKRVREPFKGQTLKHDFEIKEYVGQLRSLVRNELLSDVILSVSADKYFAHRAIIAARCPALAKLFPTDSKSSQPVINLAAQVPFSETLARLLDYIYTDEVELQASNVVDIYSTAVTFELVRLQQLTQIFIRERVSTSNIIVMLKAAHRLGTAEIERFLLSYLNKDLESFKTVISSPEAKQLADDNKTLYVLITQVIAQGPEHFANNLASVQLDASVLTKEIGELLTSLHYSDVRIVAKDGDVFAHKVILQARCPVFLDEGMIGSDDDVRGPGKLQVLKFPTLEAEVIHIMLQAFYYNSIFLEYLEDTYGLIELADRVTQENVVSVCDEMMRRNLNDQTALKILMVSSEYELVPLKKETLQLIVKQAPEILKRHDLRVILSQWPWNLIDIIRALVRPDAGTLTDEEEAEDNDAGGETDEDEIRGKSNSMSSTKQ